jgi:hypothetical protein
MNTQPDKNLRNWIAKRKADLTPDGVITRIELWHVIDGEPGVPLSTFVLADRPEDEDPDDLTQEIWNEAEEDAATRPQGSYQRYMVRAFRADDNHPEESKAFLCHGRAITALIGSDSHSATPRGALAQDIRQNDNLHAMVIRLCQVMTQTLEERTKSQSAEIEHLHQQRRGLYDLEQRLKDREHERLMEREAKEKADARVDSLVQTGLGLLSTMGPLIMGKLLSGSTAASAAAQIAGLPPPGSLHPRAAGAMSRDMALYKIAESLSPEQLEQFIGALRPEQQLAFLELWKELRNAHEPAAANEESSHEQEIQ